MKEMSFFILFVFGAAIGSFLNVVILRYDGEHFLFDTKVLGGRSHCPHCGRTLRWFELVPIASFLVQRGKCRSCEARLNFQYPLVELASALIFAFVPWRGAALFGMGPEAVLLSAIWVAAFEILLVLSVIDLRLGIIPDETEIALALLALFLAIIASGYFGLGNESFLGPFAALFGGQGGLWPERIFGALAGGLFFALLVLITRGKGMGLGDVKLATALGFLFGWPDIAVVSGLSFILGALVGGGLVLAERKKMKEGIPFGPFLALGALTVFFFGSTLLRAYFQLTGA